MKLAIVQDYLRGGGTEKNTVFLANAFCAKGWSVDVVCFRPGGVLRPELHADVGVYPLQSSDTGLNFFAPGLRRTLCQRAPDIVLLMGRMANAKGGRVRKVLPDTPIVATLRTGNRLPAGTRKTFLVADFVLTNSAWASQRAVAAGASPGRSAVIHNSITRKWPAEAEWAGIRDATRARFGVADEEQVWVKVAGFRKGKGQLELLQMLEAEFAQLPTQWQLWLVGEGAERAACERFVEASRLRGHVRFCGFVREPLPYLLGADAGVFCSRMESQPNAVVEMQAAGLPVVAFDVAGVGECLEEGETGFCLPAGDAAGFIKRLVFLSERPEQRAIFGQRARRLVEARFSPGSNIERYESVFRRLVAAKDGRLFPT